MTRKPRAFRLDRPDVVTIPHDEAADAPHRAGS